MQASGLKRSGNIWLAAGLSGHFWKLHDETPHDFRPKVRARNEVRMRETRNSESISISKPPFGRFLSKVETGLRNMSRWPVLEWIELASKDSGDMPCALL